MGGEGWGSPQALNLTLPPTPGRLVDVLKNYEIIFYLAGSEVVLAGLFMAVATSCCLRPSQDAPPSPGTEGGASDTEDAEAEGASEPLPAQEPSGLEALEVPSPGAGPEEPEVEAEPGPGPDPESV